MEKINFANNDAPYLSAENLNQMQDNIEEAIKNKSKIETIWDGDKIDTGLITLSKPVTDYDFIIVVNQGDNYAKGILVIPVSTIEYSLNDSNNYNVTTFQTPSVYASNGLRFENSTSLNLVSNRHSSWSNARFKKVIGVKL